MKRTTYPDMEKKEHVPGVRPLGRDGESKRGPLFGGTRIEESITIDQTPSALFSFWRNFENLPTFCRYLKSVEMIDQHRSRWTASGPADRPLTWEATIIEESRDEFISWRSFEGSDFVNSGSVWFRKAPGGRGTEVHVVFAYNTPGGPLGAIVAKVTGRDPAFLLKNELRRFKALIETGEIPTTEGQPVLVEKKGDEL